MPAPQRSLLNDLSGFTRTVVVCQTVPAGLFVGLILSAIRRPRAHPVPAPAFVVVVLLLLVLYIGGTVWLVIWTRRTSSELNGRLQAGAAQLVADPRRAAIAPARVLRSRRVRGVVPAVLGAPTPAQGDPSAMVFTVLAPDGPPRRVAALVPEALLPHLSAGGPAVLGLHPDDAEVAVLDTRVDAGRLAVAAADPRWRTERLPTDRSVVGGWLPLAAIASAGFVVPAAVVPLVALLLR